jgi:hypothetical protein
MRVFVNATAVDVETGATALDCVRRWNEGEAEAIVAGKRLITDSRGLPAAHADAAKPGSIYRTIASRAAPADE